MGSIRLYTGDDGHSHIEEIDPPSHPEWSQLQNAKGIIFRASPPGILQRLARSAPPPVHYHPFRRG